MRYPLPVSAIVTAGLLGTCSNGGATSQANALLSQVVQSEATWLMDLQLKEPAVTSGSPAYGALPMHPTEVFDTPAGVTPAVTKQLKVEPYFTNLGVTGLLDAVGSQPNAQATAKRWIDWYFRNINTAMPTDPRCTSESTSIYVSECDDIPGSIDWHFIDPATKVQTKVIYMDSSDAYAATFLTLLKKYYDRSGDKALIIANRSKIRLIRNVMTQGVWQALSRRTIAKTSYPIEYLMDNVEVYEGLLNVQALEKEVGLLNDTPAAADNEALLVQYRINDLKLGLEDLFTAQTGLYFASSDAQYLYNVAAPADKASKLPNISTFYPNATAQLFSLWTGLLASNPERAQSLWTKFNAEWDRADSDPDKAQHQWAKGDVRDDFPWAVMSYTAAVMGDKARATAHLSWLHDKYDANHSFPWYVAESGWVMRAAAKLQHP